MQGVALKRSLADERRVTLGASEMNFVMFGIESRRQGQGAGDMGERHRLGQEQYPSARR